MFRGVRRSLVIGVVGVAIFLMALLTAIPTAAASPFTRTGCPSGNFACLRAHHVSFVPHVVYVTPRYAPVYVAPRYVAPQYVAPQNMYMAPSTVTYAMPYTPTYAPMYAPGMMPCHGY